MIELDRLKTLLSYCPDTGDFRWLRNRPNGMKVGDIAGCQNKDGYIVITILGRQYPAHRLAWFYMKGEWCLVDHRDSEGSNNRWNNLREATQQQNCQNRRGSGKYLKGTYFNARDRIWTARIMKDGCHRHLGTFHSEVDAHAAYVRAASDLFGEFARAS